MEVAQRARELELEEDEHLKNLEGELESLRLSVGQQRKQSSIFETDAAHTAAEEREHQSAQAERSQRLLDRARSSSAFNLRELLAGGSDGGGAGGGAPESLWLSTRGSLGGAHGGRQQGARAGSRLPTCGLCWRVPTMTHPSCASITIPCILIEGQFDPVLHSELDLNVEQQIARLQTMLQPCKMCARHVCKDCLVHAADSEQQQQQQQLVCSSPLSPSLSYSSCRSCTVAYSLCTCRSLFAFH